MPEKPISTLARRDASAESEFRSVLRRASAIPLLLVVVFGVVVLWQLSSRIADSRWVDHTDQVIATAESTSLDFANAASDLRGYLLVEADDLRDRYEHAYRSAGANLQRLGALVLDSPVQVARVRTLTRLSEEWKDYAEKETALKKSGGDYVGILRSGATVKRMDAIDVELSKFVAIEQELRNQRSAVLNRGILLMVILVTGGSLLIAGLLVYLNRRDLATVAGLFQDALSREGHAREVAEQANRAKSQFLNTVSHELRNPLHSVLMWVRVLQTDSSDPQRLKRGLEAIERGARSQAQLTDDLIDTARIESGKLRLDVRPVDVAVVIQAAIETVSLSAESKQLRIQAVLDPNAGRVAGDAERLQQIFWNLLSNAVKFSPRGERIQVHLERINSHLEVSVSDNGRGIDPAELPNIFGRFWQAEGARGPQNPGLGLGLSIAQHLAELHGGSITAFSDGVDKGAVFRVRLPIMIATDAPSPYRRHPTVADSDSLTRVGQRLDGVSVLAVDDQPDAGLAVEALLRAAGAEVRIANSAEEALMVLDSWMPDVIVSDIEMPGKDGLSLIREIRLRPEPVGVIPALAVTAYGRVDDKIAVLDAGYQAHVIKPFDSSELTAVIASLIGRRFDAKEPQR